MVLESPELSEYPQASRVLTMCELAEETTGRSLAALGAKPMTGSPLLNPATSPYPAEALVSSES